MQAEVDVSKPSSAPARILELFVYPHGGAVASPDEHERHRLGLRPPGRERSGRGRRNRRDRPTGGRIEPYSSRGPVTIIAPLAATRQKPDCSGVDGVRVTGAGSFPTGFWGTSAAAPHAAGLAALLWSGRQDASGAQVRNALLATADDLGTVGADTVYGAGRLNATAMYALFSPAPRQPTSLPGRIEAEDYDTGGEGVAYHDNRDRKPRGASTGRARASISSPSSAPRGTTSAGFGRANGCGTPSTSPQPGHTPSASAGHRGGGNRSSRSSWTGRRQRPCRSPRPTLTISSPSRTRP